MQIFFGCYETQQLILGTGTAIWWVTEPHCGADVHFVIYNFQCDKSVLATQVYFTHTSPYVFVHTHTHTHPHVHACVYNIHIYAHTHLHTYTHTHIPIYYHTHTHRYINQHK